jgi:hypothetical protein
MEDELKRFIAQHKDEFDGDEPKAGLWNKIEAGLDEEKVKSLPPDYTWMWKAATLLLLFTVGFLIFNSREIPVADENQSFEAYEKLFTDEIDMRRVRLDELTQDDEVLFELDQELKSLEKEYELLKAEYLAEGQSDRLRHALMLNLQSRKQLLSYQEELLRSILNSNSNASIDL